MGAQPKRRKTEAPKEAQPAAEIDPEQPWELRKAQPWADKEVAPAVLNEEQQAYLEQVGTGRWCPTLLIACQTGRTKRKSRACCAR